MKSIPGPGCALLSMLLVLALLPPAAQAQEALRRLHVDRGSVVVEYERATAEEDEFARLSAASPPVIAVAVAKGAPDAPTRAVAAAYADALRASFPGTTLAVDGAAARGGYLAEVAFSSIGETVEVQEEVYAIRHHGVSCTTNNNSVDCGEKGGAAPVRLGTRPVQQDRRAVAVTIRLQRLEADGGGAVVFEDRSRIGYPEGECEDDVAAAATLAAALAGNARSPEPLNIRFDSSPRRLRCR